MILSFKNEIFIAPGLGFHQVRFGIPSGATRLNELKDNDNRNVEVLNCPPLHLSPICVPSLPQYLVKMHRPIEMWKKG